MTSCDSFPTLHTFLDEVQNYPHFQEIQKRIAEAQNHIGYTFNNISFLMLAFCRRKIDIEGAGKKNKTYMNDTLAQVGDAILDLILVESYFKKGKNKKEIDDARKNCGNNSNLFNFTIANGFVQFCYNDKYFHGEAPLEEQVAAGNHDSIVEAIIGAIYLDAGIDAAREWISKNILHN